LGRVELGIDWHGVGLRAESFGPQIAFFESSHSVYAIDLPGHGESMGINCADPQLSTFSTLLKEFADEVIGESFLLVGHSLGAMIALDFSHNYPDQCYGVVSLNAVHRRLPEADLAVKQRAMELMNNVNGDVASAPVRRWFGDMPEGIELEAANDCRDWLKRVDRYGYAAAYTVFAHERGLSDGAFARLRQPHLFLTGEEDGNSTPEMSQVMADLVPQGQAVIVAGARHLAQLTHSAQVNATLGSFFKHCEDVKPVRSKSGEGVRQHGTG